MDDSDDWLDVREFHIALGGSTTVTFAKQLVYDRAEHFEAAICALEKLGQHTEHRPINLEFELEAYFLSLFACLERTTISVCEDLQEVARLVVSYHDIRGPTVFARAVKYLQLFEAMQRIDPVVLNEIGKYQIVRHAVAHGVGVSGLDGNKLETVLQLPGLAENKESEEPELTKDFCCHFKEFAYRYIDELAKITMAFGARTKQKVSNVT